MRKKNVIQIDPITNKPLRTYPSIRAASRKIKVNKETIRLSLNTDRLVKGFKWITEPVTREYSPAKILLLDIETAPSRAYIWGLWKQDIYPIQIISNWYMLSWAAKWLYDEDVHSDVVTGEESIGEDDSRILASLWKMLDEADIVVGHNLDRFDLPRIKTRFLINDIEPPSFYKQLDTLKVAKKEFDFSSNSLDYLATILNVGNKKETTFTLWQKCVEGDKYSLEEMKIYNIQDVRVLEDVYLKLRPYIKGHPNLDLYVDSESSMCPHCGTSNITKDTDKYVYTQAVRYQMYRCNECLSISRSKKGTPYNNKKQISAIPR